MGQYFRTSPGFRLRLCPQGQVNSTLGAHTGQITRSPVLSVDHPSLLASATASRASSAGTLKDRRHLLHVRLAFSVVILKGMISHN